MAEHICYKHIHNIYKRKDFLLQGGGRNMSGITDRIQKHFPLCFKWGSCAEGVNGEWYQKLISL